MSDYVVALRDGRITYSGPPADIGTQFARRMYEFAGDYTAADVSAALADVDYDEIHERGKTFVIFTPETTSARSMLMALLRIRGDTHFFVDLSASPERLLDGDARPD